MHNRLCEIQKRFKCAKENHNSFGNYNYRNAEQMLAELKPICAEYGTVITMDDDITEISGRFYVKSTVTLTSLDGKNSLQAHGWAREAEHKTKSDDAQVTGMASSYARKYALGALFAVDDGRDFDSLGDTGDVSEETEQVQDSRLDEAKQQLWTAIKAYCAAYGGDPAKTYKDVWKRRDFEETPVWLMALAKAYEDGIE